MDAPIQTKELFNNDGIFKTQWVLQHPSIPLNNKLNRQILGCLTQTYASPKPGWILGYSPRLIVYPFQILQKKYATASLSLECPPQP